MPINIGKNLKIEPTNDTKVSKFVRNYNQINDYFTEKYSNPKYYAYYCKNGSGFSPDDYSCIFYSTELWTSEYSQETGRKDYFYSWGRLMGIAESENDLMGNIGTLTISEFTEDGFVTSGHDRCYRVPGMDLYADGKINGQNVVLYCYKAKAIADVEDGYAFLPIIITPENTRYYTNLIISYVDNPTYQNIVNDEWLEYCFSDEVWFNNGVLMDDNYEYIRYPEYDIYNYGEKSVGGQVLLYDLLYSLLPSVEISYINLPSGATFKWYSDELQVSELPNPATVKEGQKIYYSLEYADGSMCDDEFVVSGYTTLDLSTLEPNIFKITFSVNKTPKHIYIYHNWTSGSTNRISIPTNQSNVYSTLCNKNENIRISVDVDGWTETDQLTSPMNLTTNAHTYYNVTQNITDSYEFNYVAYNSARIFLKDENNNPVVLDSTWLQYITWSPSDATKFKDIGILTAHNPPYYNAYFANTITLDYTINVPNYGTITGTFSPTSSPEYNPIEQTKTLVPLVTYTIVPYPSDATVTLAASGYTQQGNSITVPKGTNVVWMVAKEGYETQSGNISVTSTQSVSVVLEESIIYGVDVADYQYTNDNKTVVLTKYIGSGGNIVTPGLEEIIE